MPLQILGKRLMPEASEGLKHSKLKLNRLGKVFRSSVRPNFVHCHAQPLGDHLNNVAIGAHRELRFIIH